MSKIWGVENLVLSNVKKPIPKDSEVLIKTCATSVTTSDVLIRRMNEISIYKS
ncbi:hypothetical protein CLV90_1101 [Maribacter spongiicola]|uniref:Uncharacterized protein n=1 Tax=Maribacter spongiicola TaxID=1206753 RepID=A0A4R7K8L3_9FLAO|nr:hypothetical protein CLV90_1101 [Maribacter spongiicola]